MFMVQTPKCKDNRYTLPQVCLKKFLDSVEQTLVNFSHAESKVGIESDEMKLVESLCGTVASKANCFNSLNRDFLYKMRINTQIYIDRSR